LPIRELPHWTITTLHQPQGAGPRFLHCIRKPGASALRLMRPGKSNKRGVNEAKWRCPTNIIYILSRNGNSTKYFMNPGSHQIVVGKLKPPPMRAAQ
jgi:hypothetical protein